MNPYENLTPDMSYVLQELKRIRLARLSPLPRVQI